MVTTPFASVEGETDSGNIRSVGKCSLSGEDREREKEKEKADERVGKLKAGVVALGDRDGDEGGKEKDGEIETMTKDEERNIARESASEQEGSETGG